ncbi:hypothetical protein [Neobacillus drentensis]|nr:hypothetical protein [Neobacillus drentensis]
MKGRLTNKVSIITGAASGNSGEELVVDGGWSSHSEGGQYTY